MKMLARVEKIFVWLAMVALFAIMIIIACDGLGRQFFNKPITGAYLLIEKYLMVAMVFPVIGYTWGQRGHISMTLFVSRMPNAVRNVLFLITLVFAFLFFAIILHQGFQTTYATFFGHKLTNGLVRWPLWLSYIWMPVGALACCLRILLELLVAIRVVVQTGISSVLIDQGASAHEGNSD